MFSPLQCGVDVFSKSDVPVQLLMCRLRAAMHEHAILASIGGPRVRLATHLDIDDAGVARGIAAFADAMR